MKRLILLFVLASGLLNAAIAYVQLSGGAGGDTSPLAFTFDANTTAGNMIVVMVHLNSGSVTSLTDTQSNTYTLAVSQTYDVNTIYIYYAKNIVGGATTVSLAFSGSAIAFNIGHEYSGLDTTSPLDKTSSATGGSGAGDSGAQTTTVANELIFGVGHSVQSLTGLVGSGFTERWNATSWGGHLNEDKIVSSTGSYSATFGDSGGAWIACMATFKGATASARRRVVVAQ